MAKATKLVEVTGVKVEISRMQVDEGLKEALRQAAAASRQLGQRRPTSLVEYMVGALLLRLEADGFDISAYK